MYRRKPADYSKRLQDSLRAIRSTDDALLGGAIGRERDLFAIIPFTLCKRMGVMLLKRLSRVASVAVLAVAVPTTAWAQDPQYSQFYAAPLYLNPAFAGSTNQARAGLNYRNQWPSLAANFTTISAFFDMYIEDINSGVGAIITRDQEGTLGLQSFSLGLQYSYNLKLTQWLAVRAGVQATLFYRSINFDKLTFSDQFDPQTGALTSGRSAESLGTAGFKFFPSITSGALFYTKNAWLGASVSHINQPNQSVLGETSRLPLKVSVHAGFKFFLHSGVVRYGSYAQAAERSITPTLQYRHQGVSDQMDLGLYFTIEPIVIGAWYKGLPFRSRQGVSSDESVVFLVGFTKRGNKDVINIGYSYDYTISPLTAKSGGAHEVSLNYSWPTRNPRKPPKDKLVIPCPRF